MARHRIPRVIDDYLQPRDEIEGTQPGILLGSAAWYAWLNSEAAHSFSFRSSQITLTVRREQHQSNRYWYAYYTQHGQLRKTYLGRPEKLTPEQLHGMAVTLCEKKSAGEEHETNAFRSAPTRLRTAPNVSESNTTRPCEETLLTMKFFIPPAVFTLVNRPRLIARLAEGVSRPLTLLTAPAGWGKTTLLSAWHADSSSSGSAAAWVSLDTGDNDPVRFWTYVITALSNQCAGTGETALALLRASQSPSIELVLTTLLNVIAEQPIDTVLVLDNYHVIETQSIHSALTFMVEHLPPWLHLVIATRFDPPLPLARLRVRGALTEIRAADLRFTFEETTMFLTEVMKLPFSAEQVAALETRTEGWIAGLQLAAISAQGHPAECLGQFVEAFTGSSRYVMEYLVEEVLQNQTEDIQHFLLHTSILDRLSGPLCDAVLNKQESQRMLEYLERVNLFIVSLDDEQRWFRYHNLFAEVLRSHLQQTEQGLLPALHRRASIWYEQQGFVAEAVQHVLVADAQGDRTQALSTLERALVLAKPEGYTRLLVDEGEPMLTLLTNLYTTSHSTRDYLQTLLAAGNHVERGNNVFSLPALTQIDLKSSQPLLDPLSERELEVMRLMADGASNYEIAGQLVVAISTIKRHVSNIFSKLSVNSRTQAVARAREIGLL